MSARTYIQRKKAADRDAAPQFVHDTLRAGGQPIDDATRAFMEPRFGHDFGQVQIQHTIPASAFQPKLTISQPGDPYEQEADRVADQIMRTPDSVVQRAIEEGASEEEQPPITQPPEEDDLVQRAVAEDESEAEQQPPVSPEEDQEQLVQRYIEFARASEVAPHIETGIAELRGGGQPLDRDTRAFMEPRFGHDFGQVRVHTGAQAAESAHSVNAVAYTIGSDVVFGAGQYQPSTDAGRRLLAHELAHVVQQEADPLNKNSVNRQQNARTQLIATCISRSQQNAGHILNRKEGETASSQPKMEPSSVADILIPTFTYPMVEAPIFGPMSFDAGAFAGEITIKQIWTGSAKPVSINSLISIGQKSLKAKADVAFGQFSNGTSVKISPTGRLSIENEFSGPVGSVGFNIGSEGSLAFSMSGPPAKIVLHGFEIEASLGYELELKIIPKATPVESPAIVGDDSSIVIPVLIGLGVLVAIGLIVVNGVVIAGAVGTGGALTGGAVTGGATATSGAPLLIPALAM